MITKLGKEALVGAMIGPLMGPLATAGLTAKEREALEKKYNLPEGANLGWRNAGRGLVGGSLGWLAGAGIGEALGGNSGGLPMLLGAIVGSKLMTDKYSSRNARKIMELNSKEDVPLGLIAQKIHEAGLGGDAARGLLAYYAGRERARKEAF